MPQGQVLFCLDMNDAKLKQIHPFLIYCVCELTYALKQKINLHFFGYTL